MKSTNQDFFWSIVSKIGISELVYKLIREHTKSLNCISALTSILSELTLSVYFSLSSTLTYFSGGCLNFPLMPSFTITFWLYRSFNL